MPQVSIDRHWETWFRASVYKHFKSALPIVAFVEEQVKTTDDKTEWYEIRMDGLFVNRQSKRSFEIDFEVNILVNYMRPNVQTNIYRIHELAGYAQNAFSDCINIRKYGPSEDAANDGDVLTQAIIHPRKRTDDIEKSFFGLVDSATSLFQATVEGHYTSIVEV